MDRSVEREREGERERESERRKAIQDPGKWDALPPVPDLFLDRWARPGEVSAVIDGGGGAGGVPRGGGAPASSPRPGFPGPAHLSTMARSPDTIQCGRRPWRWTPRVPCFFLPPSVSPISWCLFLFHYVAGPSMGRAHAAVRDLHPPLVDSPLLDAPESRYLLLPSSSRTSQPEMVSDCTGHPLSPSGYVRRLGGISVAGGAAIAAAHFGGHSEEAPLGACPQSNIGFRNLLPKSEASDS
eukprot:9471390-Pyramimonas_sp.AAC.5